MRQNTHRTTRMAATIFSVLAIMLAVCCGPTSAYALDADASTTQESAKAGVNASIEDNARATYPDYQDADSQDATSQDTTAPTENRERETTPTDATDTTSTTNVSESLDSLNKQESALTLTNTVDQKANEQLSSATPQAVIEKPSAKEDLLTQTNTELSLQSDNATLSVQADDQDNKSQVRPEDLVAVYRLYNRHSGEHFYTLEKDERNYLSVIGWTYEGVGWMAPKSGNAIYRLYNPNSGDHHYTLDSNERNYLPSIGWVYEGIAFHSPDGKKNSVIPVYRQFNPNEKIGTHNFTCSKVENNHLASIGWHAEGVGWYCYAVPVDFKDDFDTWGPNISGNKTLDRWIFALEKSYTTLSSSFDYVKGFKYINGDKYWSGPRVLSDALTASLAEKMLNNNGGNCYQYASLFSWLARNLGYDSQVISGWVQSHSGGKAPHGWVEIKQGGTTYVCDPDMAHALPGYNWYMVTYDKAPITYYNW